jgi:hypothetical protein
MNKEYPKIVKIIYSLKSLTRKDRDIVKDCLYRAYYAGKSEGLQEAIGLVGEK